MDVRQVVVIQVNQHYTAKKYLGNKFRIYVNDKPGHNQDDSYLIDENNELNFAGVIIVEEPFQSYTYEPGGYHMLYPNEIEEAVLKIMDLLDNES